VSPAAERPAELGSRANGGHAVVLEVDGLCKSFGGLEAVKDLSLVLEEGQRHGVLGPNGAGKTTLFNLICGVYPVTSGRISVCGFDVTGEPVHIRVRRGLGRTFQITNLFQEMTVLENVLLATTAETGDSRSYLRRLESLPESRRKAEEHLGALGLADLAEHTVDQLGYGQQRQLEVALALALKPRVLLLDEPTAGLSQVETAAMTDLVRRLPATVAVVMIEHDLDVIFNLVDTMTVMHRGQLLCTGAACDVRIDPRVAEVYLGR